MNLNRTSYTDRVLDTISLIRGGFTTFAPAAPVHQVAPVLERNNNTERRGPGRPRLHPLPSKSVLREQIKVARSLPQLFGKDNMRDTLNHIRRLTNTPARAKVDDQLRNEILSAFVEGMTARQVSETFDISIALAHNLRREAVKPRKRINLASK